MAKLNEKIEEYNIKHIIMPVETIGDIDIDGINIFNNEEWCVFQMGGNWMRIGEW